MCGSGAMKRAIRPTTKPIRMMKMMCMASPLGSRPLNLESRQHRHMVRGELPVAQVNVDMVAFNRAGKSRRGQDMVEPPAAVGLPPVVVAVAPPRIELLGLRHEAARHVDPGHRRHHLAEQLDL